MATILRGDDKIWSNATQTLPEAGVKLKLEMHYWTPFHTTETCYILQASIASRELCSKDQTLAHAQQLHNSMEARGVTMTDMTTFLKPPTLSSKPLASMLKYTVYRLGHTYIFLQITDDHCTDEQPDIIL